MFCGIDRLFAGQLSTTRRRLRDARVATLTHAAAVDHRGRSHLAVLRDLGVDPVRIFSPEHGLHAVAQAEEAVPSVDAEGQEGPAVISLYGTAKKSLAPSKEHLEGVEVLVIDLADVGSRYYTYVWTALLAMRAAAEAGVHTLVLDRPNPISGDAALLEGAPQAEGFTSFIGLESVPIRHCMTIAELLVLFAKRQGLALGPEGALSVVSTQGWERAKTATAWGRPFVMPSPNMPTIETALLYPGGCLVEGTNLSEGRGTTAPFKLVGAPFLDGEALAARMTEALLPGVQVRAVQFRPTFEKHAGKVCHGVALDVVNKAAFRPVMSYLTLLALARAQAPEQFEFRTSPYEFEVEHPAFDLLTGSAAARTALLEGADGNALAELVCPVPPEWAETVGSAEAALEEAAV